MSPRLPTGTRADRAGADKQPPGARGTVKYPPPHDPITNYPTVELIGDCLHLSPLTLQAAVAARGPAGSRTPTGDCCFVTDAISEPIPGRQLQYQGGATVNSEGDSVLKSGTDTLCGSCTNLHATLKHTLVGSLGLSLAEAVPMVSSNPARIARIDDKVGTLRVGLRADMVLLTAGLDIRATLVGGQIAFGSKLSRSFMGI